MEIPTQTADRSSSLHVFGIPELASLICKHLARKDNLNLLYVCRHLFTAIRPFVWENTDAIDTLVMMIPETRTESYIEEPFRPYVTMYLPGSLNLSRVHIYAPFIKNLDIPLKIAIDTYKNWGGFLDCTRSIDLLPNLEHLRLVLPQRDQEERISIDSINWITVFLSSSLLSLQLYPGLAWDADPYDFSHAWIGLEYATTLLQHLSEKCRLLTSLKMLPGDVKIETMVHPDGVLGLMTYTYPVRATFWSSCLKPNLTLTRFNFLRELSATPFILEPAAFRALSGLPYLESLSIRDACLFEEQQSYCFTLDSDLTEQAFPTLRCLDLLDLNYETVVNICKQRPLARALRRVKPARPYSDSPQNALAQLLDILVESNSPVSCIYIDCIPSSWRMLPPTLECLSCLKQLTHLCIPQPNGASYQFIQLLRVIPSLESLEMNVSDYAYQLKVRDLGLIATLLPNLKAFSGSIKFSSASLLGEQDFIPPNPRNLKPFYFESHFYDEANRWAVRYTERIARYLYTLWPYIECKSSRFHLDFADPPPLVRLKQSLSQLRSHPQEYGEILG